MIEQRKIAYTLVCYSAKHSGVYKKIGDQVAVWERAGYAVQIFVITDEGSKDLWQNIDRSAVTLIDSNFFIKWVNRFKVMRIALKSGPSLVYLRDNFPIWLPKTSIPIVVEVQSLVGQELKLRSKSKYQMFSALKKPVYSRLSGAVYVTNELMNRNEFCFESHIPRITIGNGIDLSRINQLPQPTLEKLALFFVGSPDQPWHGVEELVEFGELNSDVEIHIVGSDGVCNQPNVVFHGILNADQYQAIASRCQAGVGSLKLTKNHMMEASPLKVREYLALGLPVILRYKDTDLRNGEDYILELPADSRPLSDFSREIHQFLQEWSEKRVPTERIQHLDVNTKEKIRIGFFEKILTLAEGRNNQEIKHESKN
jgi:glycosyltransferase involved in cell wall biosynthesis